MSEEGEDVRMNLSPKSTVSSKIKNNRRYFDENFFVRYDIKVCKTSSYVILSTVLCCFLINISMLINTMIDMPRDICYSRTCNRTGNLLLQNMNQTINPCDNFYDFVCGKSDTDSILTSLHNDVIDDLSDLIIEKTSEKSPQYLKKLYRYHKACMDQSATSTRAEDDLRKLFKEVGWPFLKDEKLWNDKNLEWTDVALKLRKKSLPFNYFLQLSFQINATNSSKKVIYLSNPVLETPNGNFLHTLNTLNLQTYEDYMINVTKIIIPNNNIEKEFKEVLQFQTELAKILPTTKGHNNISSLYSAISVNDLELKYPCAKWLDYLNQVLSPYAKIEASEIIYISDPMYMKNFCDLMTKRKPPSRVLVNYALWRIINDALVYLSKTTHDVLDRLLSKAVYKTDMTEVDRKRICALIVNDDMNLATSALYVQNVHDDSKSDIAVVKVMAEKMRETFVNIIKKVDWLPDETKSKIVKKISFMDLLIGYPNELLDDSKLNDYYKDLIVMKKDNPLKIALNLYKFRWKKEVEGFTGRYSRSDWTGVFGQVTQSDAAYSFQNAMYISRLAINSSFFNKNNPAYINYAMLGFILGHEMSHSLTAYTRLFDEHGNLQNDDWWNAESTDMYITKLKCIIKKYNSFNMDGEVTLNENMADITGLRLAYHTYLEVTRDNPREPILPGFDGYTRNQMFWIAAGSAWCQSTLTSASNGAIITNYYQHAPDKYRVLGPTSILTEFAKDFQCKTEDQEICQLW